MNIIIQGKKLKKFTKHHKNTLWRQSCSAATQNVLFVKKGVAQLQFRSTVMYYVSLLAGLMGPCGGTWDTGGDPPKCLL